MFVLLMAVEATRVFQFLNKRLIGLFEEETSNKLHVFVKVTIGQDGIHNRKVVTTAARQVICAKCRGLMD